MTAALDVLFAPRSIAVVGASERPASEGARLLRMILQHGFEGAVYPVNPRYEQLAGLRAFPDIGSIPGVVDVAAVLVAGEHVPGVIEQCVAKGVRHAVVFSGGVEVGALRKAWESGGADAPLHVTGPNCLGVANVHGGTFVTFSPAVDFDLGGRALRPGSVAVVAQSGALGYGLVDQGRARGLGFSLIATTGNEVDLGSLDFVEYALGDPDTRIVMLLVEGLRDAPRVHELAARAREVGKTIIALKLGSSAAGARAAQSHTAHLAGSERIYAANLEAAGILRVRDTEDMIDAALALSRAPSLGGSRIGIVGTSGGAGVMLADACEEAGFSLPDFATTTRRELTKYLPEYGSDRNPIDGTGHIFNTASITPVLTAVAADDGIDGIVLATSLSNVGVLAQEREALFELLEHCEKPVILYTYTVPSDQSIELFDDLGLAWYLSPRQAVLALKALREPTVRTGRSDPVEVRARVTAGLEEFRSKHSWSGGALTEHRAKDLLRAIGVRVPVGGLATDANDAVAVAEEAGFPVVCKIQAVELAHKSDVGGVMLGITDPSGVVRAFEHLDAIARERGIRADGVLVEAMAFAEHELIVGGVVDADFGPHVMVGAGGIYAEILDDVVFVRAPASPSAVREALGRMRMWALLTGSRGRRPADIDALVDLVVAVSELLVAGGEIGEIDLNPVLVGAEGEGCTALDALIV